MFSSNTSAVSGDANYIEDVFSTYLYTGTGAALSIVNNIDLATKGGLTWIKGRSSINNNTLFDTARGATQRLFSDSTSGQSAASSSLTAFNTNGFSLDTTAGVNGSGTTFASWTFRKQPKFFDIVTYTGNGGTAQTISHNLGSTPGCMIIKATAGSEDWLVWHRSYTTPTTQAMFLNTTDAATAFYSGQLWNNTAPTSTGFTVKVSNANNTAGVTYVAYIFAHDAGGFGLTGTDNVISCGSFTTDASYKATVNLGYEPQWILTKQVSGTYPTGNWRIFDTMRGWTATANKNSVLYPNLSDAEGTNTSAGGTINSTGFVYDGDNNTTYIYIAIRRGPMKVPTDGTKVFKPLARAGTSADAVITGVGFSPDTALIKPKDTGTSNVDRSFNFFDRLRKPGYRLSAAFTDAEDTSINFITSFDQDGMTLPATGYTATNGSSYNYINYFFRRAPSFFDVVCFTMGSIPSTYTHNLGVKPEFMIAKRRSAVSSWVIYHKDLGATKYLFLPYDSAVQTNNEAWYDTEPTTTQFTVANYSGSSGTTNVWYGFATCPGVSKVGSYTGTGTTKQVDCGFAAGARFVLIKRTDSTGDWYVWDTARGIVSGNDPYLLLNSTAAEVTSTDYIDTYSAGFEISSTAPAAINASGGTFIFLAIA